ncbi:MAG TPA: DUF1674 domain-containing protein [Gammaproteobacteria bacterium]
MEESGGQRAEEASTQLPEAPATIRSGGAAAESAATGGQPREIGGPGGAEPTRYGDWERAGRCIDF